MKEKCKHYVKGNKIPNRTCGTCDRYRLCYFKDCTDNFELTEEEIETRYNKGKKAFIKKIEDSLENKSKTMPLKEAVEKGLKFKLGRRVYDFKDFEKYHIYSFSLKRHKITNKDFKRLIKNANELVEVIGE